MRKGVVDIGTNTFNLLIAKYSTEGIEIEYSTKRGVAIGMGGLTLGILTEENIDSRLMACGVSYEAMSLSIVEHL